MKERLHTWEIFSPDNEGLVIMTEHNVIYLLLVCY